MEVCYTGSRAKRSTPGIEPGTSSTLRKNHAPRPSRLVALQPELGLHIRWYFHKTTLVRTIQEHPDGQCFASQCPQQSPKICELPRNYFQPSHTIFSFVRLSCHDYESCFPQRNLGELSQSVDSPFLSRMMENNMGSKPVMRNIWHMYSALFQLRAQFLSNS